MPIVRYLWKFADGSTSNEANPKHTYGMAGAYRVYHETEDNYGNVVSTTTTIYVSEWDITGGLNVSRTNKCYCLGFTDQQGIGFHENSGTAWPFPEAQVGVLSMLDDQNQRHTLVLNNDDGLFYDITTRDGPGS